MSAADVDQALTERCTTSGEVIAGHIAAGMLDVVSRPAKLPELTFPDDDPDTVRRVWELAVAVGYRAGKHAVRPDWTAEGIARLKAALYEAGYRGMGRLAVRTANTTAPVAAESEHDRVTDGFDGADWDTSTWGGGHP
ncbi:hypothetical protein [Streptomyces sp. NPDC060366]|uniref:hypothetical protein n=1 Tax=Streptomyces sp. NPDC060366 TaxID=3347105 RepID=UPI0036526A55